MICPLSLIIFFYGGFKMDINDSVTVGIYRSHGGENNCIKDMLVNPNIGPLFYLSKQFDIDLCLIHPYTIDMDNNTVEANFLLSDNSEIRKTITIPKIIESQIVTNNTIKQCFDTLSESNHYIINYNIIHDKKIIYDRLSNGSKFKDILIPTYDIRSIDDIFVYLKEYNPIIIKPKNSGMGYKIIYISEHIDNNQNTSYEVVYDNTKYQYDRTKFIEFYKSYCSDECFILQPYIQSRTKDNRPYTIRIYSHKGINGRYKSWYFVWIPDRVDYNGSGRQDGEQRYLNIFLQLQYPNDWKTIYDEFISIGDKFPQYYQSLFKNFDIAEMGLDMGIQKLSNGKYEIKLYEVNTPAGITNLFPITVQVCKTYCDYFKYLYNTKVMKG